MSLASINTAARVRDVIKRQAIGAIDRNVPKSLIGRVVSLDLPRQTARVWFTGDEQPVQVRLFSSTIPGKWQSQLQPGLTASTNLAGYGSMVSCQRLNGELYITDVITGGQFSYDLTTMNQYFVATYPYAFTPGSVFGQVIAAKTHCTIVADATVGQSVEFGPFIKSASSAAAPWVKINADFSIGSSEYEFSMPLGLFNDGSDELDRWFRILPSKEASANLSGQVDYYDLDVCVKNTMYGIEPEFHTQSNEYWFRLIKRDADSVFISADLSFETNLFDHPRSVDGNERLIQAVVTRPPEITGYIGFHNSEMNVFDLYDVKVRDRFDRTLAVSTTAWGTSDDDTTWTLSGGTSANYSVSSNRGDILPSSTGTTYNQVNSRLEYDFDVVFKISPSLVAVGASHRGYALLRRIDASNYYRFQLEFTTAGNVSIYIEKNVATVFTTLQTTAAFTTYTAGASFWVRAQIRNSKLRMKVWASASAEPQAWSLSHTSDTSITGAGALAMGVQRVTSNTNSTLVTSFSEIECNLSSQARFSEGSWATGPYRSTVLRVANELQKTWTISGGSFTFDGTYLSWTGELVLSGIGKHRNGLKDGAVYVTCPINPTEYVIPVFGNTTPTTVAVNAAGIPLAAGRSLYVAIPPGERNVDLIENLFLVDSATDGVDFQLPEWAILIAHRQPGTDLVRLGNGAWPSPITLFRVTGPGGAQSANSTTYISKTGGSFTFVKNRSSTIIDVIGTGSDYCTVAGDKYELALQISGTDYSIGTFYHNTTGKHDGWAMMNQIPSIPAGTYTVLVRFRRNAGTGQVTWDNNDLICIRMMETT